MGHGPLDKSLHPSGPYRYRIRPDSDSDTIKSSSSKPIGLTKPASNKEMKRVYGKAFLIHLNRGDVEMATVFAKAFLLTPNGPENNNIYR